MVGLTLLLFACESVEPASDPFAPARVEPRPAPIPEAELAFPEEPPLEISSEQMAAAAAPVAVAVAEVAPALEAAPPPAGLPSLVQWPVRLLTTLPEAQPPRAVLGLPSGEERVVSPGSILAEEGLVVMTVSAGRVQLARVQPAGDHATITTMELSAQYP